jgi:hypothetical protein
MTDTITLPRATVQQALEALEFIADEWGFTHKANRPERWRAIDALKAALEQPEQEPVAWRYQNSNTEREYLVWNKGTGGRNWTPLYTHPPRREWRSLSEEEVDQMAGNTVDAWECARAAEAALKEKNHG